MKETRTRFNKMIAPGLFSMAVESFQRFDPIWKSLVRTEKSDKAYEECVYTSSLGAIPLKPEGKGVDYQSRIQGPTKRWTHDTWAGGVRMTQEAIEDDLYKVMGGAARELGVSAAETQHINTATIFNTGFLTTTKVAGDNLAIFSSAHVRLGGGTWSNLATASSLSYSTLQSGVMAFEGQTDNMGKKIKQTPMTLLVPPALEFKALELLKSVGKPETATNELNALKEARGRLNLVVWNYLTSTTAWFLIGDNARQETGLIHFQRIPVTFARENDFDTGDAKFRVRWRDSVEINYPIGLYGNAGL